MSRTIRVGAIDWRHPAWAGSFYPTDLPEEWRLTFYASQFNCVFLPARTWREGAASELEQWCDDVHSEFRFLLQSDEISTPSQTLGDKTKLIDIQDGRIHWFDKESDLKHLVAEIRAADDDTDCYLVSRDGDLGQMERINTLLELMGY